MADLEDGEILDSDEEEALPNSKAFPTKNISNNGTIRGSNEIAHTSSSVLKDCQVPRHLNDSPAYRCATPNATVSSSDSDSSDEDTPLWRQKKAKYFRTQKKALMDLSPELPPPNDTSEKMNINSQSRRVNNVWGSVLQEQSLTQNLSSIGVEKDPGNQTQRDVESYDFTKKYEDTRPHIIPETTPESNDPFDKVSDLQEMDIYLHERRGKKRKNNHKHSHNSAKKQTLSIQSKIEITAEDSVTDIVDVIADMLNEPKVDLIERVVDALGKEKAIDILRLTKTCEEGGGMLTLDGSRRRTSGGVYLQLMKSDKDVTSDHKKKIFKEEYEARAKIRKEQRKSKGRKGRPNRPSSYQNQKILDQAKHSKKRERMETTGSRESDEDEEVAEASSDVEVNTSGETTKTESMEDIKYLEEDVVDVSIGEETID